ALAQFRDHGRRALSVHDQDACRRLQDRTAARSGPHQGSHREGQSMNAPAHPVPASQAVLPMKILRATTQEVVVLVAREPGGGWPALRLILDGQDYATINPGALVTGDATVAEIAIPLPALP